MMSLICNIKEVSKLLLPLLYAAPLPFISMHRKQVSNKPQRVNGPVLLCAINLIYSVQNKVFRVALSLSSIHQHVRQLFASYRTNEMIKMQEA